MAISGVTSTGTSVAKFGAIGSGDETTALQAAIDGAAGGKLILDPTKTYSAGQLTISSPMTLDGNGATLVSTQVNGMAIVIAANDVVIENLEVSGSDVCRGAFYMAGGEERVTLRKNILHNFGSDSQITEAIYFGAGCNNLLIESNEIYEVNNSDSPKKATRGIRGAGSGGLTGVQIIHNNIHEIRERTDGDAIVIQDFTADANVLIAHNTITNAAKRAIKVQAPGVTVLGNVITMPDMSEASDPRCAIELNDDRTVANGNTISGPNGFVDGVIIVGTAGTSDVMITNNRCSVPTGHGNTTMDGVLVNSSCTNLTISNNIFNTDARNGVKIDQGVCSNVKISDNIFDECGNTVGQCVVNFAAQPSFDISLLGNVYSNLTGYFVIASAATNISANGNVGDGTGQRFSSSTKFAHFHVAQNGAVGDGTDESVEIQLALDNVLAAGGIVEFDGDKEYRCYQLQLDEKNNITLRLNGATLRAPDTTGTVANGDWILQCDRCENLTIENGTFDGNRASRGTLAAVQAYNLYLLGGKNIRLSSVNFVDSAVDGLYIGPWDQTLTSTYPNDVYVDNCSATGNYRNGVNIVACRNVRINGGTFANNTGADPQSGIHIFPGSGSATVAFRGISIRDAQIYGNSGYGICVDANDKECYGVRIERCDISACTKGAVLADGEIAIVNNDFHDFSTVTGNGLIEIPSASVPSSNGVLISQNRFEDILAVASVCVYISGSSGKHHKIRDCRFHNIAYAINDIGYGTSISGCTFLTVSQPNSIVQLQGNFTQLKDCQFALVGAYNCISVDLASVNNIAEICGNHFIDHNQNTDPTYGLIRTVDGKANIHDNVLRSTSAETSYIAIRTDSNNCYVTNNRIDNMSATPIDDNGTGGVVADNIVDDVLVA